MSKPRRKLCVECHEEPQHPGFDVCKYCLGEQDVAAVLDYEHIDDVSSNYCEQCGSEFTYVEEVKGCPRCDWGTER